MAPIKRNHRLKNVNYRDRALVTVARFETKAFKSKDFIMKAKLHSRRAGEKFADETKATTAMRTALETLIADGVLEWNEDTEEILIPAETYELFGKVPERLADDRSPETYITHSVKLRELFPPSKPKTKKQYVWDYIRLFGKFGALQREHNALQQQQGVLHATLAALLSRSGAAVSPVAPIPSTPSSSASRALQADVPATPYTPARSSISAAPIRRAYTTPAVFKAEDFDRQMTPASVRAPFLAPGMAPPTPVSNPRPARRMDTIREDPPSPTASRQGPLRSSAQDMFVDEDEDDAMGETASQAQPNTSLFDKGKQVLRLLAARAVTPLHVIGAGRASSPTEPGTPGADVTIDTASGSSTFIAMDEGPSRRDTSDEQIENLRTEVAELKARLRAAQRDATDKDSRIVELQERLAEKQAALEGLVKGFMPVMPALAEAAKHVAGAGSGLATFV